MNATEKMMDFQLALARKRQTEPSFRAACNAILAFGAAGIEPPAFIEMQTHEDWQTLSDAVEAQMTMGGMLPAARDLPSGQFMLMGVIFRAPAGNAS